MFKRKMAKSGTGSYWWYTSNLHNFHGLKVIYMEVIAHLLSFLQNLQVI